MNNELLGTLTANIKSSMEDFIAYATESGIDTYTNEAGVTTTVLNRFFSHTSEGMCKAELVFIHPHENSTGHFATTFRSPTGSNGRGHGLFYKKAKDTYTTECLRIYNESIAD